MDKKRLYNAGLIFFAEKQNREEEELIGLVQKHLSCPDACVLENGVGTGRFIRSVRQRFPRFSCFGIDVVPDFADQKMDGVTLSRQSAEKMDFQSDSFDAIFCIDVLHHVPDRQKALAEMNRVIKKGGIVVFRDIRPKNPLDKLFYRLVDLSCLAYNSNLPQYFQEKEWEQNLQRNGFRILEIKRFDSQLDWIVCQKKSEE